MTRSPLSRVFSIDPDGMKNAWNKKLWTPTAMAAAITSRTTASTQNGRACFAPFAGLTSFAASVPVAAGSVVPVSPTALLDPGAPRVSSTPKMSAAARRPLTDLGGFGAFGGLAVLPGLVLRCAPGGLGSVRGATVRSIPTGSSTTGSGRGACESPASRDVSAPGWCRASRGSWPSCPEAHAGSTASPGARRRE